MTIQRTKHSRRDGDSESVTIQKLKQWGENQLRGDHYSDFDSQVLLCHVLEINSAQLISRADEPVASELVERFKALVELRINGMPIAYITGVREFWSLPLIVNQDVLIPRPETELVVESVLSLISSEFQSNVLELGAGSGAISLAIGRERPNANIIACDKSESALIVARQNQQQLKLENICWVLSDWFDQIPDREFDVICANPPYISSNDSHLETGDVRSEPRSALVSGIDGLDDLGLIISQAHNYLKKQGWLVVEHGYDQGKRVRRLFENQHYSQIRTFTDLGNNERVTQGCLGR